MWTFTAILGTALCRPGNIVLATVPNGATPIYASATISGGSSVAAAGTRVAQGQVSIVGVSTVTAAGTPSAFISANILGAASLTATLGEGYPLDADVVATALFFIDPAKVFVTPFVKATTVRTVPAPPTIITPQVSSGPIPNNLSVGPAVIVPKTRTSGIPNKG